MIGARALHFVTGFDASCGWPEPGGQTHSYARACEWDLAFPSEPSPAHHPPERRPASIAPSKEEPSRLRAEGARPGARTRAPRATFPRRRLRPSPPPPPGPPLPTARGGRAGWAAMRAGGCAPRGSAPGSGGGQAPARPGGAAPGDLPHHLRVCDRLVKG